MPRKSEDKMQLHVTRILQALADEARNQYEMDIDIILKFKKLLYVYAYHN
jgi:hypothetical protein